MSVRSKLTENFAKPVLVGVTAYLGSMALLPTSSVVIMGNTMNSHMYYGILGVGGSFASELAHNWLLPYIPGNSKFSQTESMILAPAVNAGIFVLGTKYFIDRQIFQPGVDLIKPALLGGGSEIVGQYVFESVIKSYV